MTPDPSRRILSVSDLHISFLQNGAWFKAVSSLNFHLNQGSTLALVGESGSGKSVTCLALLGLLAAKSSLITGKAIFNSVDLLSVPEKDKRSFRGTDLAMIFQEPMTSLNPVYTCGEQVAEILRLKKAMTHDEAKKRTFSLFEEVGLSSVSRMYSSYPHQLSGGQRQRVMIAMALSCSPKILIADEPTTALDVTVQHAVLSLLKRLQKERDMSMLFISHDLGVVSQVADHVMVMLNGSSVEQGTTSEILSRPRTAYTKGLLASRPASNQGLRRLPTISDFTHDESLSIETIKNRLRADVDVQNHRKQSLYASKPLLVASDISKSFGTEQAVNKVSFSVFKGETLGLVGESGSGKTTLGRSVLRLIEPDAGSVDYDGVNLLKLKKSDLRRIRSKMQIIFQDPYASLNPRMTAGNAILEPMLAAGFAGSMLQKKERVYELLQRVDLRPEFYNRYPHEFSGGQRQRIGIARALAVGPEFIVCDESVSALDVSVQAQVINLLLSLREEFKLTYIFISHDLSVVRFLSDRIMVLNKGKVEELATSEELFKHPKSAYTKRLIDSIPKTTET